MENIYYYFATAFIIFELMILASTDKYLYMAEKGWSKKPENRVMSIFTTLYVVWAVAGMFLFPEEGLFVLLLLVSFLTMIAESLLPKSTKTIMRVDAIVSIIILMAIIKNI